MVFHVDFSHFVWKTVNKEEESPSAEYRNGKSLESLFSWTEHITPKGNVKVGNAYTVN